MPSIAPHLSHIIFYVQEVERALTFYEQAFGFSRLFLHESGDYGELATGSTRLAFCKQSLADHNLAASIPEKQRSGDPHRTPPTSEIVFTADPLEETYERALKAGGKIIVPPTEKPWGQTVAYLADLEGFLIELASPISP